MAKKTDPKLLQEALKRFKLLSEYSFYTEEPKDDDNLILGNVDETDDEKNQDLDFGGNQNPTQTDDSNTSANTNPTPDANPTADANPTNTGTDVVPQPEQQPQPAADTTPTDIGAELPEDDEVDIDVTELVDSTEEAKNAATIAGEKSIKLMKKFSELESKINSMASITNKIDALEKEIARRNPTPNEKLEMRSLDSAPFNVKLRDFWKDIDGYDTGTENKPKEYILKKDDIDDGFLSDDIKKSFNVPDDDNQYEEEEI